MTVFENFFFLETGRILTWIFASRSQQDAWKQLGEARVGEPQKGIISPVSWQENVVCTMGFSSWKLHFGKVEKLQDSTEL